MSRLSIEYCFKNEFAKSGYTKGTLDWPRNPAKTLAAECERLLVGAAEKEKRTVILVAWNEYGS